MWGIAFVAVVLVAGACFAAASEAGAVESDAERPGLPSFLAHGWTWSGWDAALLDPKTPSAQYNRGVMHATGHGQPQNDAEALKWFREAARGGHALAQCNLGILYARGRGVPQDKVLAWVWFHFAAGQGDGKARANKAVIAASMTPDDLGRARKTALEALQENGLLLLPY